MQYFLFVTNVTVCLYASENTFFLSSVNHASVCEVRKQKKLDLSLSIQSLCLKVKSIGLNLASSMPNKVSEKES